MTSSGHIIVLCFLLSCLTSPTLSSRSQLQKQHVKFQRSLLVDGGLRRPDLHRPGRFEHAETARWLVASNTWGIVSTISVHLGGTPFGNVASFSDFIDGVPSGTPYFYLTALDPTAYDAQKNASASLTLSEETLGTCGKNDPENPLCAKLTLTGTLEEVALGSDEHGKALEGIYAKHAEMRTWPKDHDFRVFALRPRDVFLIDFFGGARPVTVEGYYAATPPFGKLLPV